MYVAPYEKMICDSDKGDGGVYFYDEYFEWVNRSTGGGFRIEYKNIKDIQVVRSHKKRVTIITNSGESRNLYLYRVDTFVKLLTDAMDRVRGNNQVEEDKESDLDKLERLAKLHESGALSDEEFQKAKEKILG